MDSRGEGRAERGGVYRAPPIDLRGSLTIGVERGAVRPVPDASPPPLVLFTAFEPSGDELAGPVIRALLERSPAIRIVAWGGPRMRAAGAEVREETTHNASMGVPGPAKIAEHFRLNKRIGAWLCANQPTLHVAVDSPAANFPICKMSKAQGSRVVHLAAPQVWAWARHRVHKLRRRTDLVLCLLPFEEDWFRAHDVPAKFIGHPLFDESSSGASQHADNAFPSGSPRVALLPGSRSKEWRLNFPAMLRTFRTVADRWPEASGVVVAASERGAEALRHIAAEQGGWPESLSLVLRDVPGAARWCDAAMAVSGTVSLHLAREATPMVLCYRLRRWQFALVGRWVVRSDFATLPNLIAGKPIVPEFVPYAGEGAEPTAALMRLLAHAGERGEQRAALREACAPFRGRRSAIDAAETILGLLTPAPPAPA